MELVQVQFLLILCTNNIRETRNGESSMVYLQNCFMNFSDILYSVRYYTEISLKNLILVDTSPTSSPLFLWLISNIYHFVKSC